MARDNIPQLTEREYAIKAIETVYAGCRFRSRLEARWAVFFDTLGVKWLYEPQGYVLGNGETYLPDFWLPKLQLWVEVKGAATQIDWIKLHAATAADGLPLVYGREETPLSVLGKSDISRMPMLDRILLLGEVPQPTDCGWEHVVTSLSSRGPSFHGAFFWTSEFLRQLDADLPWPSGVDERLFAGFRSTAVRLAYKVEKAYNAARKARFEHGERG